MFVAAIEKISQFTRPLHSVTRYFNELIVPGASTFFFVNNNGVALTCKHVADLIISADRINQQFNDFKTERHKIRQDSHYQENLQNLCLKYNYNENSILQLKNNFRSCFDKIAKIDIHMHPTLDLAILEFKGFESISYRGHAVFIKDSNKIKQGQYLCRLGYPFPEFNNFELNKQSDNIEWTNTGLQNSPTFPIDGIVTRFIADPSMVVTGIELSTPGLRGQSGGPLFDTSGLVYGMQFATKHLHLGFDSIDREIINGGNRTKVSNYPFLHVGLCVHVDKIKEFLHTHKIEFSESDPSPIL